MTTTTNPQRTVTISISGTGADAKATYSYVSPVTGAPHVNATVCDLECHQASYCLYILDFASTQAGWTLTGTSPNGGHTGMTSVPGALNLSLLTFDPYTCYSTYRFYLHYLNTLTGAKVEIDPQEGNVPRR
ncbi:MAG: hypothetical protein ABW069_05440 [Duganella sp.]